MPAIVNNIEPESIAEDLEIKQGEEILAINEIKPLDLIDYQYLIAGEEVSIHLKRLDGSEEIIDIEKDYDDDLGITFESAVFDKVIPCTNRCMFCFVDQQPDNMRQSLYVKDDDYRLSYLQGTYVTLTNLTKKHKERIAAMGLGPLYVSVHTTNPELRVKMLNNPKAANIMNDLKWLNNLNIPVHTQIVLCPEINDGKELERSLNDLASLKTNIMSIAVVPVGITKYREGGVLKHVTKAKSLEVIEQISEFNKKLGYNLAFASDEFYIIANESFPKSKFYNGFGQMDDGVGVCRLLLDDFDRHKKYLPKNISSPKNFTIATGKIACEALKPVVTKLNQINNLNINLIPIKSHFWGEEITVAGLITGSDLITNLSPIKNQISNLIIPSVMLRKYTEEFLDDLTLSNVQENLSSKIHVVENYYSTKEIIDFVSQ